MPSRVPLISLLAAVLAPAAAFSQTSSATAPSPCGVAPIVDAHAHPNIFSPQQEMWLGEAEGDAFTTEDAAVKDASLNQHLQAIVDNLAQYLPEPHVKFKVILVESPEVNGWSIAGGSIYITRKLAATAKSDDELAGVLGHEMGHIASHQFAFEMTADFKRLLNVTTLSDRKDVYTKFQLWLDAILVDKHPQKDKEDEHQDEADKIGIYLTASAGYNVAAFSEFFDRSFFVQGKTGGTLSDLLGLTKPDQKRLRGMKAMTAALPVACQTPRRPAEEQASFEQWRRKVREDQKASTETAAAANEKVLKLDQPLQMEVNRLRFSPDGKLLLAQDESSIYVLTHEPFAVKFRLDADSAERAYFSPDSTKVTFITTGLHTEEWSVADGKLLEAHEPVARHECVETRLSPDGRTIACLAFPSSGSDLSLSLLDSTSGEVLWQSKRFFTPTWWFYEWVTYLHSAGVPFELMDASLSADGNTLVIGPGSSKVAFDLRTRQPIKLANELKMGINGTYAFIGNDRLAGVQLDSGGIPGIFSFPDGKRLAKMQFNLGDLETLSNTGGKDYASSTSIFGLLKNKDEKPDKKDGYKNAAKVEDRIAVIDMDTNKWLMSSHSTALDLWDTEVATEAADGSVALGKLDGGKVTLEHKIELPISPLGTLHAVAMSPDGKLLAYSTRDRGSVWSLQNGKRLALLHPFRDVTWPNATTMVGDFEKSAKGDREVTVFDLATHSSRPAVEKLADDPKDTERMDRDYLTEWKAEKGDARTLLIHSFKDHSVVWSKTFAHGIPWYTIPKGSGELIFTYSINEDAGRDMLKAYPALAPQAAAVKKKEDGRVIEIVDGTTGLTKATMVLEKPADYYGTDGLKHVGDDLLVTGADNRTLVYSVTTGKREWQTFGWVLTVDPVSQRIAVWNRANEAIVFNAAGEELLHTRGGEKIRWASFIDNGAKVVLLTSDQSIHTLQVGDKPLTK